MRLLVLLAISDITVGIIVVPMRLTAVITTQELTGIWPLGSNWTCKSHRQNEGNEL